MCELHSWTLLAVLAQRRPSMALDVSSHVRYFRKCLEVLPGAYSSLDTNRLTVIYFCVSGLDLLGEIGRVDAPAICDYIYAMQVLPSSEDGNGALGGFRGGSFLGAPFDPAGAPATSDLDSGHIAMAYTALATLVMLGDDLSRVRREAVLRWLRTLQGADGCFRAYEGGEADMRFVYCAAVVCVLLRDHDWVGMDVQAATEYILASQAYDGGIGLGPGMEGHGGSSYTALAALTLMGGLCPAVHPLPTARPPPARAAAPPRHHPPPESCRNDRRGLLSAWQGHWTASHAARRSCTGASSGRLAASRAGRTRTKTRATPFG